MRQKYADSYIAKFESPFTAFLYEITLNGFTDDETYLEGWGEWAGRIGRRTVHETSHGAVSHITHETEDAAQQVISDLRDQWETEEV